MIGTLMKYRNILRRHLGYVGSSLPVTGEISKVPWGHNKIVDSATGRSAIRFLFVKGSPLSRYSRYVLDYTG